MLLKILYTLGHTSDRTGKQYSIFSPSFMKPFTDAGERIDVYQMHFLGIFAPDMPTSTNNQRTFPNEYIIKLSDFSQPRRRDNIFHPSDHTCHSRIYRKDVQPPNLGFVRIKWLPTDPGENSNLVNKSIYDRLSKADRKTRMLSVGGKKGGSKLAEIIRQLDPPEPQDHINKEVERFYNSDSGIIEEVDEDLLNKNMLDATIVDNPVNVMLPIKNIKQPLINKPFIKPPIQFEQDNNYVPEIMGYGGKTRRKHKKRKTRKH